MRYLVIVIFLVGSISSYGQNKSIFDSIRFVGLKYDMRILPGGTDSWESYKVKKNGFRHKVALGRQIGWRIEYKRRKTFKKGNKTQLLNGLDYYFENRGNNYYNLDLKKIDFNSLIDKNNQLVNLNLTDSLLNKYLSEGVIRVDFKYFFSNYGRTINNYNPVLDGVPFNIKFDLITYKSDTLSYGYYGNLWNDVPCENLDDFFLFYHLQKEFNVFSNLNIVDYYINNQLEDIVLKFIAIKEETVDTKDLTL